MAILSRSFKEQTPALVLTRPITLAHLSRRSAAAYMLESFLIVPQAFVSVIERVTVPYSVLTVATDAPSGNNHDDGHSVSGLHSNTTCRHPDGMVYYDARGVKREIKNMTFETHKMSLARYNKGDIEALDGTPV